MGMHSEGSNDGLPGQRFRQWVLSQRLPGFVARELDADHLRMEGEQAHGEVNFYAMTNEADSPEIVELRIRRAGDEDDCFFLHFMMEDLARAQELFGEMAEALSEEAARTEVRVLLCCTCGITTNMFATKMSQLASTLGLGLTFQARPLEAAVASGEPYAAVMLAPQVAHQRQHVAEAFPQAVVFEIPARIYGSYDAAGAVRLVSSMLDRARPEAPADDAGEDLRLPSAGDLTWGGRILVVSAVLGTRQSSVEWRLYEGGQSVLAGRTTKRRFDYRDVEDVFAAVQLGGVDVTQIDAVGIAVPGVISDGAVSLKVDGIHDYALADHIRDAYGVRVYLDNDANAAAIGCYMAQSAYRSVAYHRQDYGAVICGQGSVVHGRLVHGRRNFAGELGYLVHALDLSAPPEDLVWTEEGMYEVVSAYLLCNACAIAPDAIYVDAYPASDMERLRGLLAGHVGEENVPELIPAPDFNECIFTGELGLCVQRLRRHGPSRTGSFGIDTYLLNK